VRASKDSGAAHPLDHPVWNALTTRQAGLAVGGPRARRMAPEYGPFGAAADGSAEALAALAALPVAGGLALVEAAPGALPDEATLVQAGPLNQMIAETPVAPPEPRGFEIVALGEADADEMQALAALTRPGPFAAATHRLGRFLGVRWEGRLAAMAGERMKLPGYTEVSAVCVHPDARGRGYAQALTRAAAARIAADGETAFLHVFPDNLGAIRIYESLGFRLRRVMALRVLGPAARQDAPPAIRA
jgi:ribosomal protein S18 acetylase RimI-like enzyme